MWFLFKMAPTFSTEDVVQRLSKHDHQTPQH